jgi:hypothetical protein
MLYLAIDANFRLRLKARGIVDPELGSGWAYFVEESEYAAHVKRNMKDKDVSCPSLYQRPSNFFYPSYKHVVRRSELFNKPTPSSRGGMLLLE